MERLVVDGWGKFIGKKDNQVVVKEKGSKLHQIVAEDLRQVVITGSGSISFDAIKLLAKNGVDIVLIDWKGDVTAKLSAPEMRTVSTRKEQYFAYKDERGVNLAKKFVMAKLKNQYALLGTWAKTRKDTEPVEAEMLISYRKSIKDLIDRVEGVKGDNIESERGTLIGLEGRGSKLYWNGFSEITKEAFGFQDRSGRNARDGVNAMLNYGYALLEGEVHRSIHFAGLDPYGGYLHADRPGKPSLVLDMMEEFRQQVVDRKVMSMIQKKEVSPSDFTVKEGRCWLPDGVRKNLIKKVLQRMEDYIKWKNRNIRWCDLVLKQAREVGKYLRGETNEYECFYLRW